MPNIADLFEEEEDRPGRGNTATADYDDSMPIDVPVMTAEEAAENARTTELGLVQADPLAALVGHTIDQDQWEREQYDEEQNRTDNLITQGFGNITQAGQDADAANNWIVGALADTWAPLGQEVEYGEFVGPATSDPNAAAWQYGAMDEYGRRAQGGFTPVEEAQMEVNRRMQERDLQSQRDAQLQDLRMRGIQGSGLEVAGLLGAQQVTGETRMLADMEQAGIAAERADRALDSGAQLAGDIRGQSFGESSFNQALESDYQRDVARHVQSERERQWGGAKDIAGSAAGAVADAYQHQVAPTQFWADVETDRSPTQPTGSQFADAVGKVAGADQADKAAAALDDDDDSLIPGLDLF